MKPAPVFLLCKLAKLWRFFMGTKVLAPLVWGLVSRSSWAAFKMDSTCQFSNDSLFCTGLSNYEFLDYLLLVAGFGFWNAPLPQFEALTLNHLGLHVKRYSAIRLWSSIGFILAVISLPLFD